VSEWTHSICERCWLHRHGGRVPTSLQADYRILESCCFCDRKHESGIYLRHDPKDPALKCGGEHEDEMNAG
jgi:hypothetical protein